MRQTLLPPQLVDFIKAKVLAADIFRPDWSYDSVFDGFIKSAPQHGFNHSKEQLLILAKSTQMDYPVQIYNNLINAGFDDDSARQISAFHQPLSQQEYDVLNLAVDREEFLEKLSQFRPFLAAMIKKLEQNIRNTPYIVSRLITLGFPKEMIDQFIIYKSMRPRSNMSAMVKIPKGKSRATKYFGSEDADNLLIGSNWLNMIAEIHQDSLFPVVRYGAGETQGIYTQALNRKIDDKFCGTFYYYENDSDITLNARDILIAPNKICATAYLLGIDEVVRLFSAEIRVSGSVYPPHLVEYVFDTAVMGKSWKPIIMDMISGNFNFLHHEEKLYAVEDRFDQVLCDSAKGKFDIVVLTTMTGQERMVTEILDPRNRQESFASLIVADPQFITDLDLGL